MAYALAITVIWLVLFGPPGLLLHRALLGRTAMGSYDLALAPISGLACGVVALSVLATLHVRAGATGVQIAVVVVAVLSGALLRRLRAPIRGHHLAWAILALVIAVIVIQVPVWEQTGGGPVAYATRHEPVLQTAEVRAAAGGSATTTPLAQAARHTLRQGYPGFAQLAGFTVGLGDSQDSGWSAFGLTSLITALLAAFTVLPVITFARARGMGWFTTAAASIVGALSPLALLGIGLAEGPGVMAVPFSTAAAVLLLRAGADRGRWALAAVCGAAVFCILGPLGLLPLAGLGVGIVVSRLVPAPPTDRPVDAPLLASWSVVLPAAAAAVVAGIVGAADGLIHARGLPWDLMFRHLVGSVREWPLAWVGTGLDAHAVSGPAELAAAALGVLLAIVATVLAVRRRTRMEVAVVVGAVVVVVVGLLAGAIRRPLGQDLLEFGLLATAPLLAVVCVRAVTVVRAPAAVGVPLQQTPLRLLTLRACTLLGLVFVGLSVAASLTSGSRMTHTPPIPSLDHASLPAVSLDASRWVSYALPASPGIRARRAETDVDQLTGSDVPAAERVDGQHVERIVTNESPFASDPPSIYAPDGALFGDPVWDSARISPNADGLLLALRHDPVEPVPASSSGPDVAGGLVAPPLSGSCNGTVATCIDDIPTAGTCSTGGADVGTPISRQTTVTPAANDLVGNTYKYPGGLACWTVPLDPHAQFVLIHVRQIGYLLDASAAKPRSGTWTQTRLDGQAAWTTTHRGATLQWHVSGLDGCVSAQFEGRVGAGAKLIGGGLLAGDPSTYCAGTNPSIPSTGESIIGIGRAWTQAALSYTSTGDLAIRDSTGTRVTVARVAVRDPKTAQACNVVLPAIAGKGSILTPGTDGAFEVQIAGISGSGADRTATLVLRSFGDEAQASRTREVNDRSYPPAFHFLADWTEQFASDPSTQIEGSTSAGSSGSCTGPSASDTATPAD